MFSSLGRLLDLNNLDQSSRANDVVVIQHHDGSLHSTPFNVRFGKMKMWSREDKIVQLEVNHKLTRAVMKLTAGGEAYWLVPNYSAWEQKEKASAPAPPPQQQQTTDTAVQGGTTDPDPLKPEKGKDSNADPKKKKVGFDVNPTQSTEREREEEETPNDDNNLIEAAHAFTHSKRRVSRKLLPTDKFLMEQAEKEGIETVVNNKSNAGPPPEEEEEQEKIEEELRKAEEKLKEEGEEFLVKDAAVVTEEEPKEKVESEEEEDEEDYYYADDDDSYFYPVDMDDYRKQYGDEALLQNSSFTSEVLYEEDHGVPPGDALELGSVGSVDEIQPSPKVMPPPTGGEPYFVRSLLPTEEDLQKLNLQPGHNHVRYIIWKNNAGPSSTSTTTNPSHPTTNNNNTIVGSPSEGLSNSRSPEEGSENEKANTPSTTTGGESPSPGATDDHTTSVKFNASEEHSDYVCITSSIFLWSEDDKIIISDVDGTITKSDLWGHYYININRGNDWTHPGVCSLFRKCVRNGYKIVYLTARSVTQINQTKDYLFNQINQEESSYFTKETLACENNKKTNHNNNNNNGKEGKSREDAGNRSSLPLGPVLTVPQKFFTALTKEVTKQSHIFKIACLTSLKNCFPPSVKKPFFAGFGNRINDVISYDTVNISYHKIFVIDDNSVLHCCKVKHSYNDLAHLVNEIFPPIVKKDNPLLRNAKAQAPLVRTGSTVSSVSISSDEVPRGTYVKKDFSLNTFHSSASSGSSSASSACSSEGGEDERGLGNPSTNKVTSTTTGNAQTSTNKNTSTTPTPTPTTTTASMQVAVDSDFHSFNYWKSDPSQLIEKPDPPKKEGKASHSKKKEEKADPSVTRPTVAVVSTPTRKEPIRGNAFGPVDTAKGKEEEPKTPPQQKKEGSKEGQSPLPKDPSGKPTSSSAKANSSTKGGFFSFHFGRNKGPASGQKDAAYFEARKFTHPDYLPLTPLPESTTSPAPPSSKEAGGWFWKKNNPSKSTNEKRNSGSEKTDSK